MNDDYINKFNDYLISLFPIEKYTPNFFDYKKGNLSIPKILGKYKFKRHNIVNENFQSLYEYFISSINVNLINKLTTNTFCFGTSFSLPFQLNIIGDINSINSITFLFENNFYFNEIKLKVEDIIYTENEIFNNEITFTFNLQNINTNILNCELILSSIDNPEYLKTEYQFNIIGKIININGSSFTISGDVISFNIDNLPPNSIQIFFGQRINEYSITLNYINSNDKVYIFRNENNLPLSLTRQEYTIGTVISNNWTLVVIGDVNQNKSIDNVPENIDYYYAIVAFDSFYNFSTPKIIMVEKYIAFNAIISNIEITPPAIYGSGDTVKLFQFNITPNLNVDFTNMNFMITNAHLYEKLSIFVNSDSNPLQEFYILNEGENIFLFSPSFNMEAATTYTLSFYVKIKEEVNLPEGEFDIIFTINSINTLYNVVPLNISTGVNV